MNEKQKEILKEYLKDASPEEAMEIYRLLESREKRGGGLGKLNLNIDKMAQNMADQIQKQMGMTDVNIRQMAVDMVVRLARQHAPNITDKELGVLLNEMIPSAQSEQGGESIPGEILREMVYQFVKYSRGGFTDYDNYHSPEGWSDRYWKLFPLRVRQLIRALLAGVIEEDEFIETLDYILQSRSVEGESHVGDSRSNRSQKSNKRRGGMPSPPGPRKNRH